MRTGRGWNEPYETITLPPIMSYQRFTLDDQGLSVRIISSEEDTFGLESITLSCPADAGTYFRREMELHELAGDAERMSVASFGDESIGYRYPDIETYEIVWRRGDVIGRGYFPSEVSLDTAGISSGRSTRCSSSHPQEPPAHRRGADPACLSRGPAAPETW